MLIVAYASHLSIIGEFCAISLDGNLFLLNSCAVSLKYEFGATLLYHPRFKEFLKKMVFKEECRQFWTLESFVSTSSLLNLDVAEFMKHKVHSSFSNAFDSIFKYFGHLYSIASFNASFSIVVRLLWLFEGLDLRKISFKEKGYGMTRDEHKNVKIFQGPITRLMARKIEGEDKTLVGILWKEKMKKKEAPKHS
ncbi:hypothetical protein M9H77_36188 [Catharanthus roseus]|uniref:Uncharacterized protein n=1 Tax=Catharanthus roseus TaxID=4058 RepID=A0ACB9ZT20_CATRO|nr:hypothetical protein M9H77_36188 [Catharanthus roseus]